MSNNNHYEKSIESRKEDVEKVCNEYPGRCCLYIEKADTCKSLINLPKNKFLVPNTLSAEQLIVLIRRKLTLKPSEALFFYVNRKMISGQQIIGDIYKKHKSEDGLLYVKYASENCFG